MVPVYPSFTSNAAFATPTFVSNSNNAQAWPEDPFQPKNPSPSSLRSDRPRLIAPAYKWAALPSMIPNDPYLKGWNDTIFGNATQYMSLPPVVYHMDGSSGILDNSREIKMRIKAFAYVYRMTNDTKWVERCWQEVSNAFSDSFGPSDDKWNSNHFLDTAEMSAALGIAYDWLYDQWTSDQRSQILNALNTYGLNFGAKAYTDSSVTYAWWKNNVTGNWNCVCNGGLTVAALAVLGDDQSGNAQTILDNAIDNAKSNCAMAVSTDGTWAETANYWYFGTTGHAEMASSLMTAAGSDFGLLSTNQDFANTGDFHMYVYGQTSLFNYGDHGPNKFSTTANSMIFYGDQFKQAQYILFQREQADAAEPWSMFWYNPTVSGAFWDGTDLDHFFDNELDQWVSMRSSWTDINAMYVAMKAGMNNGHQTHNDLDVGDFVLDAMGTRWAGELGSGDYLSTGYFTSEAQDAQRWMYYRKMTEGQNTILVNRTNQLVTSAPQILKKDTSGTKQGSGTVFTVDQDSTALWVADMSSAYDSSMASSVHRGVRFLNGRKQVLIQDEVTSSTTWQWRMHTNATVSVSENSATLDLDGKTMKLDILSPSGATFTTSAAKRFDTDVTPPDPDQDNLGVTVVIVEVQGSSDAQNLQVLFSPQWGNGVSLMGTGDVKNVALNDWSLTSH
ncbi:heparinase II/III family protein [Dendrothele bispora CBS 962.96]|uniref:Heparinase II/III family protein n=1 Tax=Dendrothele bispora (strain CBS 962.96) TaxID=1314807 RepID=A0A4S8MXD0_DENBC|nr:heparinase II/III family protein [Dendrothele bispora CBS 962.96]